MAVAAALADRPAVAPIFAIFGCCLLVLGSFYSRIEGGVEATREGVRTVVREIDRMAEEHRLSPSVVPDLIEMALDRLSGESARVEDARSAAQHVVERAVTEQTHLATSFSTWLVEQGWTEVFTTGPSADAGFDLIAKRPGRVLGVVLLNRLGVSAMNVRRSAALKGARLMVAGELVSITDVAVVSHYRWDEMHPYTAQAAAELAVEVYTVDDEGNVRKPAAPQWPTSPPE